MAAQARRCRRLASYATGRTQNTLELLADDYEQRQKAAEGEASPCVPVMRLGPANDLPE
jgi:hypothetical protein